VTNIEERFTYNLILKDCSSVRHTNINRQFWQDNYLARGE